MGKGIVTAAASHYGVWKACWGLDCVNDHPVKYFSSTSSSLLALHGLQDSTQQIEYYYDAHTEIKDMPKFEDHIYEGRGHVGIVSYICLIGFLKNVQKGHLAY